MIFLTLIILLNIQIMFVFIYVLLSMSQTNFGILSVQSENLTILVNTNKHLLTNIQIAFKQIIILENNVVSLASWDLNPLYITILVCLLSLVFIPTFKHLLLNDNMETLSLISDCGRSILKTNIKWLDYLLIRKLGYEDSYFSRGNRTIELFNNRLNDLKIVQTENLNHLVELNNNLNECLYWHTQLTLQLPVTECTSSLLKAAVPAALNFIVNLKFF